MYNLPPLVSAGLTGLLSGWALSIPIGPINLTIMNEGSRQGFKWAAMIGMGATAMEVIYCFIAFTGLASLFTQSYIKAVMELIGFVFLFYLSIKFLAAKSVPSQHISLGRAANRMELRLEQRFNPHSAFMTGLVRVMANLGVLVFWVFLAAKFINSGWVRPDWPGKLTCVAGVAVGTGSWFLLLSWLAAKGRGKLSDRTLLRMEHWSGIVLLVFTLAHGATIAWHIHKAGLGY